MAVCANCKREVKDNHIFCGYCGKSLKSSANLIIDGRKDKRIKYLINRVCHFEKLNIFFSVVIALILIGGVMISYKSISDAILRWNKLPVVMAQLYAKYGYMKEGLGISYLHQEIDFLFSFSGNVILAVMGIIMSALSTFYLTFNIYILYLRRKYKESYSYKKPLRLIKICFYIVKASIVAALVFAVILLALIVIKIIII